MTLKPIDLIRMTSNEQRSGSLSRPSGSILLHRALMFNTGQLTFVCPGDRIGVAIGICLSIFLIELLPTANDNPQFSLLFGGPVPLRITEELS